MMDRIQRYGSDQYKQQQADRAASVARINTPIMVKTGVGMNPSTEAFMEVSSAEQNQTGLAGAMGAISGQQTAEDQYLGGMMGMAQTGRGQQASAMSGMGNMASMTAGQQAAELAAKQTVDSAKWGAAGSLAGLGMTYYGDTKGWFDPEE